LETKLSIDVRAFLGITSLQVMYNHRYQNFQTPKTHDKWDGENISNLITKLGKIKES